jgi:hypothetical protein
MRGVSGHIGPLCLTPEYRRLLRRAESNSAQRAGVSDAGVGIGGASMHYLTQRLHNPSPCFGTQASAKKK